MVAAQVGLYLILTILTTCLGGQAVCAAASRARPERYWQVAVWLTLLGSAFFLPFFVVGTLELVTGGPPVALPALLAVALTLLLAGATARWHTGDAPILRPLPAEPIRWLSWSGLTALAAIIMFMVVALGLAMGYPGDYEALAYHLPIAVHVFQTGSLRVWDHAYMHTFPANMSLYAGLLLKFMPERLVSLANLPFVLVACFAVYGLARAAGGVPGDSLLTATGFASVPLVAFSGFTVGSDVAGIAFLGLAYLIVLAAPDRRLSWVALAGCAAGLAYGFKMLHLVGAAFLGLAVLWRAWASRSGEDSRFGRTVRAGIVYSLGFLALAGVWLLRNYVELGNPLYPVYLGGIFDALGWTAPPDINYAMRTQTQFEWINAPWQWLVYPWVEGHYLNQNFKSSSGLGAFFATTLPIAWVAGIMVTVKQCFPGRSNASNGGAAVTIAVLSVGSAFVAILWWFLVDRQPRYLMALLVLGQPLFASLLGLLSRPGARIMRGLATVAVLIMLAIIGSKQLVDFGSRFVVSKQFSRAAFYEYPSAIDALPDGAIVVNLSSRPNNYKLYGKELANRIVSPNAVALALRSIGDEFNLEGFPVSAHMLTVPVLCAFGAMYLYTDGESRFPLAPKIKLERVAELTRNPANNQLLPNARTLWRIVNRVELCRSHNSEPIE